MPEANATHKAAFGTEAGLFSDAGVPTVVCGPGSIDQALRPNEFVAAEQIALYETFMDRLMERVCATSSDESAAPTARMSR